MKSEKYKIRDSKTVASVKRNELELLSTLSEHIYEGKHCGNAVRRIDGLTIHSRGDGFNGSISFITLSDAKKKSYDAPVGALFYCKAGNQIRTRLYPSEAAELLSLPSPLPTNVIHILTGRDDKFGAPKIFRVYQSRTTIKRSLHQIETIANSILETPVLETHFENKTYGILALLERPSKLESMNAALSGSHIPQNYLVTTGIGPTTSTIAEALRNKWSQYND